MESTQSRKNDPSILLLNEIDILIAQARLAELYAKQAHALAAEKSVAPADDAQRVRGELEREIAALRAQLDDQEQKLTAREGEIQNAQSELATLRGRAYQLDAAYRNVEAARAARAAELIELRTALAEKEQTFSAREAETREALDRRAGEIDALRNQLTETQSSSAKREDELRRARCEMAALQERANHFELLQQQTERLLSAQGEQARQRFRAALEEMDGRANESERKLHELQQRSNAKITELELQLAEKQLLLEGRDGEIDRLKTSVTGLTEQVAQRESAPLQAIAAHNGVERRLEHENQTELMGLREELRQKNQALAEQAEQAKNCEQSLEAQIQDLQNSSAAQQQLLARRDHALEMMKVEVAILQDRLTQRQTEIETLAQRCRGKIETLETDLAEQLELAAKQRAELDSLTARLAQREAMAAQSVENAISERGKIRLELQVQIAALREEASRNQRVIEEYQAEISRLRHNFNPGNGATEPARLTEAHTERVDQLQNGSAAVKSEAAAKFTPFGNRRRRLFREWQRF